MWTACCRCGVHSYILLNVRKSKSVSTHYTHLVWGSHQASVSVPALNRQRQCGNCSLYKEYNTKIRHKTRILIPTLNPNIWHLGQTPRMSELTMSSSFLNRLWQLTRSFLCHQALTHKIFLKSKKRKIGTPRYRCSPALAHKNPPAAL